MRDGEGPVRPLAPAARSRPPYLKMDLKSDFFDFFQTICFCKAESLSFKNLLEFLGSEVI